MAQNDSLWFWLSWIALGATVAALAACLFGDGLLRRFARSRRCPKCWYDLSHSPGLTCSECGYTATCERQLHKWRRRWRGVAFLALAWLGVYLWNYARAIYEHGWLAGVPTPILVHFTPPPEQEYTRLDRPEGWSMVPHPVIGEVERRIASGEAFSRGEWQTLLTRAELVWARDRWPVDVPLEVGVRLVGWFGGADSFAPSIIDEAGSVVSSNLASTISQTGSGSIVSYGEAGLAPVQGVHPGRYHLEYVMQGPGMASRGNRIRVSIPMTFVRTVEEAITPVSTPEIDSLVAAHMKPQICCLQEDDDRRSWLNLDLSFIDDERTRGMAIAVEVDVLRDGEVIAEKLADGHSAAFAFRREDDLIVLGSLAYDDLKAEPERYALRIRGSAQRALRIASADSYWAGEVTIPCDEISVEEHFRVWYRN
ncbi:MAG: hypothetical protein IT430_01495 [Phycisphaerales bacterium]|nr:hypothetical protein [Phycisphaerales bacterium]